MNKQDVITTIVMTRGRQQDCYRYCIYNSGVFA